MDNSASSGRKFSGNLTCQIPFPLIQWYIQFHHNFLLDDLSREENDKETQMKKFHLESVIEHIRESLFCLAVLFIEVDQDIVIVRQKSKKYRYHPELDHVCRSPQFRETFLQKRKMCLSSGTDFQYPLPWISRNKKTGKEVQKRIDTYFDIVPLPSNLVEHESQTLYYFLLVDPQILKRVDTRNENRAVLRSFIAAPIRNWWVKITMNRLASREYGNPGRWIRMATTYELIQYVKSRTAHIRCKHGSTEDIRVILREGEKKGNLWKCWQPRLYKASSINDLKHLRRRVRSLLYLNTWFFSHHHLENEWVNPAMYSALPKSRNNQRNDGSQLQSENCDLCSVHTWLQGEREHLKTKSIGLLQHLRIIHNISVSCFLAHDSIDEYSMLLNLKNTETIFLSRDTLLSYFMHHLLMKENSVVRNIENNVLSDLTLCRLMHGIALSSNFLYGDQHLDSEFIHRMMQLISRYCHEDLKLHPRIDIRAHLLHAARSEPSLHSLKRYYRDHFFHVIEVALLGHVLLETEISENWCLWESIHPNKETVLRWWYLAALLHDIGYAIDVLKSSHSHFEFFKHCQDLLGLTKSIDSEINSLKDGRGVKELQELGIQFTDDSQYHKDHGVIGAMHLMSLLKRIGKDDSDLDIHDYSPAIEAIALHNLKSPSYRISFKKKPIAFLLALCDQLQEWRRPRLPFNVSANTLLAKLTGGGGHPHEYDGSFKSIICNLVGHSHIRSHFDTQYSQLSTKKKLNEPIAFEIEYNSEINLNSGVFQIWLDTTLNFQRLDFTGLPADFNITVTYNTPLYVVMQNVPEDLSNGDHKANVQSQLHRLKDAAFETHMNFLNNWFPTDRETVDSGESKTEFLKNSFLRHNIDVQNKRERLCLDLRALSQQTVLTQGMDTFWKHLREWKRYNEDRDFPGDYAVATPE